MNSLSLSEQLTFSTIRIECELSDGSISTGTGFFFRFCDDGETNIPAIVTNKHVVADSVRGRLHFNVSDASGNPQEAKHNWIVIEDFEAAWVMHPLKEIDLCIMPILPIINHLNMQNVEPFFISLDSSLLIDDEYLKGLNSIEDILMIGYPNGIWDSINNMPIVRRGVTATHPGLNYNGRKEFMIDAACFPGSSGSPVFLYNPGSYIDKKGSTIFHNRIKLLGVLYAGPQHTATGDIEIINVPTNQKPISISRIPNNLGIIIKSYLLKDFDSILRDISH
ncbi:serine protease [Paenibacillus sp. DR312]|uniref:S1 family peptidase n=1 Tax=unclassified Paenibacillus TaxID=185978 RepID=UPI001C94A211|nr:serine protease [Paenibacillus sp. DR312]QZN78510.1 trypsin-like peptidase domain-containing protein [Paenibacillus sp. DR312]